MNNNKKFSGSENKIKECKFDFNPVNFSASLNAIFVKVSNELSADCLIKNIWNIHSPAEPYLDWKEDKRFSLF